MHETVLQTRPLQSGEAFCGFTQNDNIWTINAGKMEQTTYKNEIAPQ
jgi:hypothetical protein